MSGTARPVALPAGDVPPRTRPSVYPADLAARIGRREKRQLGDVFGLRTFGVNLTRLAPGAWSALHHRHGRQDEFIYVLQGNPVLVTDAGETPLAPGMCAGFPAGGSAHHLENRGSAEAVILEVGDRGPGDSVFYPDDDLAAAMGEDGKWHYTRKDGTAL
jgi:uncharacterized cupin superfamily protein